MQITNSFLRDAKTKYYVHISIGYRAGFTAVGAPGNSKFGGPYQLQQI
jgi:hypothetical protein